MTDTVARIRTEILTGAIDGHEDVIREAMKARRSLVAQTRARELDEGDIVVVDGISPKYLNGLEAEIISLNKTRAAIRFLDPKRAKRYGHGVVRAPLASLTPKEG